MKFTEGSAEKEKGGVVQCLACESENPASAKECSVCLVPITTQAQRDAVKKVEKTEKKEGESSAFGLVAPGGAEPQTSDSFGFGSATKSGFNFGGTSDEVPSGGFSFSFGDSAPAPSPSGGGFGFSFGGGSASVPASGSDFPSFGGSASFGGGFGAAAVPAEENKKEELTQSLTESDAFGKFSEPVDTNNNVPQNDPSGHWTCHENGCDTNNPLSAKQCIVCDAPRERKDEGKAEEKSGKGTSEEDRLKKSINPFGDAPVFDTPAFAAPFDATPAFSFGAAAPAGGGGFDMPNFDLGVEVPKDFGGFSFNPDAPAFNIGKGVAKDDDDDEDNGETRRSAAPAKEGEAESRDEEDGEDSGGESDGNEGESSEEAAKEESTEEEPVGKGGGGNNKDEERVHQKTRKNEPVAIPDKEANGGGGGDDDSINVAPEDFGFNFGQNSEVIDNNAGWAGAAVSGDFSFGAAAPAPAMDFFKQPEAKMPDFGVVSSEEQDSFFAPAQPTASAAAPNKAAPVASASAPSQAPAPKGAPAVEGRKIVKAVRRRNAGDAAPAPVAPAPAADEDAAAESPFPALGDTPAKDNAGPRSSTGGTTKKTLQFH